MKPDEALKIIKQVTAAYKGTRQEHAMLQQAEQVIEDAVKVDKPKK